MDDEDECRSKRTSLDSPVVDVDEELEENKGGGLKGSWV